jgi:hypothetical protein
MHATGELLFADWDDIPILEIAVFGEVIVIRLAKGINVHGATPHTGALDSIFARLHWVSQGLGGCGFAWRLEQACSPWRIVATARTGCPARYSPSATIHAPAPKLM